MGFPSPVSVSGETYSKFAGNSSLNGGSYGNSGNGVYDVEDLAVGLVRLENGSTIDFEFSWASNIENDYNYYEILGTKGGAAFRDDKLKIFSEIQDTCVDITPRTDYPKKVLNEFTHFTDCIKNGSEPIAPPEEAVKLMKIIDGTYKSARTKNEVTLRL
jgi:predicted dehydrogenase